ncbi:MAG: tRNA-queuosine alpha-mannosyltransferase domain-containing protein [Spirochaetota bacterium]
MRLLFLESFYGGSHRDVADAIAEHSRHEVDLRTLPARFWKWRMRGSALGFAREMTDPARYDLIVCTGLMSIADFLALARPGALRTGSSPRALPPVLLYAHETQIVYPAPSAREADLHFAFTDLTNMLAADHVAFNSRTHRDAFLAALPGFLRRLPEHRPMWAVDEVTAKSSVCHPGVRWHAGGGEREPGATNGPRGTSAPPAAPPLVLWNHRWEFDKNPHAFFAALDEIERRGIAFRLALLGENFQVVPKPFLEARERFAEEIVHYGYAADRDEYERWLAAADVVVSTSIQENFGISVIEAIAHGARPLLPRRLSYPEIIPDEFHDALYDSPEELVTKLAAALETPSPPPDALVEHARSFSWELRIEWFDALFERVARGADGEAGG